LLNQLSHTNRVLDLQEKDPSDMARPRRLHTSGASENFDTGLYAWDGAGNVTKMGSFRFAYDLLSRVEEARMEVPGEGCGQELLLDSGTDGGTVTHQSCGTVRVQGSYGVGSTGNVTLRAGNRVVLGDGFSVATGGRLTLETDPALDPGGEPTDAAQSYTYDRFGNLLTMITALEGQSPVTRTLTTNSATNRLSVATYDLSGNVMSWAGRQYRWDAFNMLTQEKPTAGNGHTFLYGPGDERIWTIDWTAGAASSNWLETWTLRDLDGTVLRQFQSSGGNTSSAGWSFHRDFVFRNGALLAAHTPQGIRHFHTDHLGSPRIVTDTSGDTVAQHLYFPFGEEATDPGQDAGVLKFTGHERDDLDSGGTTADLDYMHRRYYSLHLGRFLSVDTAGGVPDVPQTWNRYSYVLGNPVNYIDPTGEFPWEAVGQIGQDLLQCVINGGCDFIEVTDTFDPLTGVQGLQDLRSGRSMFSSLIDRGLQSTRSYYQRRFEQQVAQGNEVAAFIDFMGLELLFPENCDELGGEIVLSMLPGGKLAKGLTKNFKYAVKKLGLNPKKASEALHAAKAAEGRRADVLFDTRTGDIIAPETGEVIGNLSDAY
jgi:RHS repeat-associated protein